MRRFTLGQSEQQVSSGRSAPTGTLSESGPIAFTSSPADPRDSPAPIRQHAQVFEPTWLAGPSGLAAPPRAFVFRPAGLEGRALAAGEPVFFDLHLFSPRPDLLPFVLTFRQLGVAGVGPGRVPVELTRVHPLDEQHPEQTAVLANGTLAGAASPGLSLDLAPTPTEFKDAGSVALRPAFCALYQGGRPDQDLAALTHSADHLRIAGGTVTGAEVERRSSKTGQKHSLGGFTGWVDYEGDYVLAGSRPLDRSRPPDRLGKPPQGRAGPLARLSPLVTRPPGPSLTFNPEPHPALPHHQHTVRRRKVASPSGPRRWRSQSLLHVLVPTPHAHNEPRA
ncbi:MAG: hypothetical protein K2X03_12315 [Bryobacteraceae bacterium]|nr:hypothetical protein [Bryobacteraceae bacterium]